MEDCLLEDPLLTLYFVLCMLSLGCIPPLSDFFGKTLFILVQMEGYYIFPSFFRTFHKHYFHILLLLNSLIIDLRENEEMTAYIQTIEHITLLLNHFFHCEVNGNIGASLSNSST